MAQIIRAQTVLGTDNAQAIDACVNTWHFASPDDLTNTELTALGAALTGFYTAIIGLLSPVLSTVSNAHMHKLYAVTSTGPGPDDDDLVGPLAQIPFTLGAGAASGLPSEVAVCLSMTAIGAGLVNEEAGSTRPKARYRGRVYLGPLGTSTLSTEATTNIVRVDSGARTTIVNAAEAMADAAFANAGATLGVYSRMDNLVRVVETFHVDNAFDTVRSRGQKANARTSLARSF